MISLALMSFLLAWEPAEPGQAAAPEDTPEQTNAGPADAAGGEHPDDSVRLALRSEPGGLTAEQVADRAVATSPQVAVMRAELMINASTVDQTIARYAPELTGEASYSRLSPADIDFGGDGAQVFAGNEGPLAVDPTSGMMIVDSAGQPVVAAGMPPIEVPLNNFSLKASLSVPFSDYAFRLLPAKRGSEAQTDVIVLQREAEKVRVELDARMAYYDWLRAVAQVAVMGQTRDEMQARLDDARVGYDAGVLSLADVERLEGSLASAESSLISAQSFERLAKQNLSIIMNVDEADFRIGEDVFADFPDRWSQEKRDDLLEEAYSERLELRALQRGTDAMRYAERTARVGYYPRLDGFAEATYANPNQRFFPATQEWNASWVVGASLTWRLSGFLNARTQVKRARGEESKLLAQQAAMRQAIKMELTAALEERQRAIEAVRLTDKAMQSSESVYAQQVSLYRGGETTTTDVLAAGNQRIMATLRSVNARIDLRVADAKLDRATGRMKPRKVEADADDEKYIKFSSQGGGKRE